jgi:hypothetical protein
MVRADRDAGARHQIVEHLAWLLSNRSAHRYIERVDHVELCTLARCIGNNSQHRRSYQEDLQRGGHAC